MCSIGVYRTGTVSVEAAATRHDQPTETGANNLSTMLQLRVQRGVASVYYREPPGSFGGEVTNEMLEDTNGSSSRPLGVAIGPSFTRPTTSSRSGTQSRTIVPEILAVSMTA
jgi:hypothetical protein